jgi:hypothetical protein
MKISEIISEAIDRREAERRFAQLVEPREIKPKQPAAEPEKTRTHTIKSTKTRHVEPPRSYSQVNADQERKVKEWWKLRDRYNALLPRVIKLSQKNFQTIPGNILRFDYKGLINDYSVSVEQRLDNTIAGLNRVNMALEQYLKYPDRGYNQITRLSELLNLEQEQKQSKQP